MALAEILESQNRFTDAKQLYEKAVNIRRKTGHNKVTRQRSWSFNNKHFLRTARKQNRFINYICSMLVL